MVTNLTAYNLIYDALRKIGVVSLGDTVPAEVAQEALMKLNTLRAEFSINLKCPKRYEELYQFTGNKQYITLGVGGDITSRPATIEEVILIQGVPQSNLNISLPIKSYYEYREISAQNITAIPQGAYIDAQYPLTSIYFHPGAQSGWTVRVIGKDYMTDYENIADILVDPPEYFEGLAANLALRLAQNWGFECPTGLVAQAHTAMKYIKQHNLMMEMKQANGIGSTHGSSINFFSGRV